jgi:hypothetical protein
MTRKMHDFGADLRSLSKRLGSGKSVTKLSPAERETRDARQAAYRLGGNRAAAALFEFWEVADCPACDPTVVLVRVAVQTWRDASGNLVASTPGKSEVVACETCDGKLRVVAYDDQSCTFGALALRPAVLADERRWQFLVSKKAPPGL